MNTSFTFKLRMGLVLLALPSLVQAGVFNPIRQDQIPSGIAYSISLPSVEDPRVFIGKKVAILASHGVEEAEITFPYQYLVDRGAQVDVLVPEWTAQGVAAVRYLKPTLFVQASGTFKQGMGNRYDLLVLTGGAWNAQVVRTDGDALGLIRNHYRAGKPVAAICAGTAVLINAGIARGAHLTGSPTVMADLVNAGARYQDQPLVIGQQLATSRSPDDIPYFLTGLRMLLVRR